MLEEIIATGKKYQVVYADPPWSYYNDSTVKPDNVKTNLWCPIPYDMMSSKDICKIPVKEIVDDTAILLIWTTDYHMEKCMRVIENWGFIYRTVGFAWQKLTESGLHVNMRGGQYTMKTGIELCLLATKGTPRKLIKTRNVKSFLSSKREHHSKKPDEVRRRIDEMVKDDLNKIELFAREKFDGWDAWGNEITCE